MRKLIGISTVLVIGIGLGYLSAIYQGSSQDGMVSEGSSGESGEKKPLYWVAPMDKNYRRDAPGKSPMGMDLVPVYEEDMAGGEGEVKISAAVENNLGVKTSEVLEHTLVMPINTVGNVQYDEGSIHHFHSRVEGWIEKLYVDASGDSVKQGQVLFDLYSPALVSAQEEYLAALRSRNQNLIKASTSRLAALGMQAGQVEALRKRGRVEQTISFKAPQSGFVIDLNVREGMFIKPATEVLSIGTLDKVWVIGEVFERQAYLVEAGQSVEIKANSMPDKIWSGQVDYLYPQLDANTRTLFVRIVVNNEDLSLKPNMLVDLSIQRMSEQPVLSVPRSALIKASNHSRVVRALGDGRYESIPVKTGLEGLLHHSSMSDTPVLGETRIQVIEGLNAGDEVVVSAQFMIDSESNVEAELLRMTPDEIFKPAPADTVTATGILNSMMPEMNMASITHDPIPEWEWPEMKMDFEVADSVDLSNVTPGQSFEFELKKTGDWDYLLTRVIGQSKSGMADMTDSEIMSKTMSETDNAILRSVMTRGKVKSLMLDMDMVEVVHEPIPEWSWPVMSMSFVIKPGYSFPDLKAGDEIEFELAETEDGDYQISDVKKM